MDLTERELIIDEMSEHLRERQRLPDQHQDAPEWWRVANYDRKANSLTHFLESLTIWKEYLGFLGSRKEKDAPAQAVAFEKFKSAGGKVPLPRRVIKKYVGQF